MARPFRSVRSTEVREICAHKVHLKHVPTNIENCTRHEKVELEAAKPVSAICVFFGRSLKCSARYRDALRIGTNGRVLATLGPEMLGF